MPQWIKELLANSQPILVALQQKIAALTVQLQSAASPNQPRGLGKMTIVVIDRETVIGTGLTTGDRWAVTPAYVLESTVAAPPGCKPA